MTVNKFFQVKSRIFPLLEYDDSFVVNTMRIILFYDILFSQATGVRCGETAITDRLQISFCL